jgi:hypothetical protein
MEDVAKVKVHGYSNEPLTQDIRLSAYTMLFDHLLKDPQCDPSSDSINQVFATACREGLTNLVQYLLRNRDDVDPTFLENVGLNWAAWYLNLDVIVELLKDGRADPSDADNYLLMVMTNYGYNNVIKMLLDDPRVDPSQPKLGFTNACRNGRVDIVRMFLEDGRLDPSCLNNCCLIDAVQNNRVEVVKLIVQDPRVNPKARSREALFTAEKRGYVEILELLRNPPNPPVCIKWSDGCNECTEEGCTERYCFVDGNPFCIEWSRVCPNSCVKYRDLRPVCECEMEKRD